MNPIIKSSITLLVSIMSLNNAQGGAKAVVPSKDVLKVIYSVSKAYNLNAQDLIRIAYVESRFKLDARRLNTNGTIDIGLFQVNSVHWTTTCKAFDVFTLKGNAECAAKLLTKAKQHSDTDQHWIGRYHSKTPTKKKKYYALLDAVDLGE